MQNQELIIERTFNAPRELVFNAWTDASQLAQWWGPKEMQMGNISLDLRPGGSFHYSMKAENGFEMWGRFAYREIVAPERIVFVSSFSDRMVT